MKKETPSFPDVSVIIPAHNEEKYVARCIRSIKRAAEKYDGAVEIIVVCNRCTDKTAEKAVHHGARAIPSEDTTIAAVRNRGIQNARGEIIITIDCDNVMSADTICEAATLLNSGKYIGGGAEMVFERYSFPLLLNGALCDIGFKLTGLYCGMFWAYKKTFDAIGGFTDKKAFEDVATAKKLKEYGKKQGKQYICLKKGFFINSTRKFDKYGDWLYFKLLFSNAGPIIKALAGDKKEYDELIDMMFYR